MTPHACRIDLKIFAKNLCEKDEHANIDLCPNLFDDSI